MTAQPGMPGLQSLQTRFPHKQSPRQVAWALFCSGLRLQTCAGRFISPAPVVKALVLVSRPKALTVLSRYDERLNHVRLPEVAAKGNQLRQPELVAIIVSIWRIGRIAPEVAEVFHQHE